MFVLGREEFDIAREKRRRSSGSRTASKRTSSRESATAGYSAYLHGVNSAAARICVSLLAMVGGFYREATHQRTTTRLVARGMIGYTMVLALIWVLLITTSERWLPATVLLYGPRVVVMLPLLVLALAALMLARRSALLALPAAFIATYGIMGFRFGIVLPDSARGPAVRVMSLNARGGEVVSQRIREVLDLDPDVIGIQECSTLVAETLRAGGRYTVLQSGAQCTASRWPITFVDSMPRLAFQRIQSLGYGGSGRVLRYRVQHPSQPFQLINLHLETPRRGLRGLTGSDGLIPDDGKFSRALPSVDVQRAFGANAEIRLRESERASGWATSKVDDGPLVITGDFNQPVESTIYRQYWSAYTNAFEAVGRGLGYTKFEGTLLRARIDHVLVWPSAFAVERAFVGPDVGSDHRPVVAEIRFK